MSSIWGSKIHVSIFGESHGAAIGATLNGLPSGVPIDLDAIAYEMARRSAKGNRLATPRKEADEVEIVSGYFEGKTTGTPLTGIIRNENTRSKDYARTKDLMRPGHADYSGWMRYDGFQDYRGGG
ncbi:MAG: chorismate synthase, partial [Eubacterium sp.]